MTFIDINDDPNEFQDEKTLRRPIGRNKAKKAAFGSSSKISKTSSIDHFKEKFDRYVQLQEGKVEIMEEEKTTC